MQHIAFIVLTLTVLVNLLFGLSVLLRVYQKPFGWYFSLTVMGIIFWAFGDGLMLLARSADLVHIGSELFYIAPMIAPVFIWYFALTFPDDRALPRWTLLLPPIPFLLISFGFIRHMPFFVQSVQITTTLNVATPHKPGFYLYSSYFSLFFFLAYVAFYKKARQLKGLSRTQEYYIFLGVLFGSVLALFSNLLLPTSGVRTLVWLGPFFSLIFPGAVTIAIVRHKLFNIRLVLIRSVAYVLALVSLAISYGLISTVVVTQALRGSAISTKQRLLYAGLAAVLALVFHPVQRFFERLTNRLFYRDAYEPSAFIGELNRVLAANVELRPMLDAAAQVIQSNLKTEFCVFEVPDGGGKLQAIGVSNGRYNGQDIVAARELVANVSQRVIITDVDRYGALEDRKIAVLARNGIAIFARLHPDDKRREGAGSYLVLGSKKSGNPFTNSDIRTIETIVNEMVISIQNATRFEEIERFNVTLQEKVDEATRKLRRTNDKLRKLDETKDDFISMASHQLRTPLTSVKGYVSMVLDGDGGELTPMQRKLLNQSFISAQRMVYLISDLLNVSRLRTGKFIIEATPVNLAQIVKDEVGQLVETAKGRGVALTFDKPERFPLLMLDDTKMRQVVMNFLDNAIYYTQRGGKIDVQLADKPHSIEFTVTDTGIGVPRHEQPHLFTKFYRANNAKRARPDGTGLGLFMAKKVIIAQGGALIFKSVEDRGSTFGFTFAKQKLLPLPAGKSK